MYSVSDDETVEWGESSIAKLYSGFDLGGIDHTHVWNALKTDKKRFKGKPRFVLLRAFKEPEIVEIDQKQFRKAFVETARKWNHA